MALVWDTETLTAGYELLRGTKPFKRWKLPPARELNFRVSQGDLYAWYVHNDKELSVSQRKNHRLSSMLQSMAHEMVHLYLARKGVKHWDKHGAEFNRLARSVCKHHGFEEATF